MSYHFTNFPNSAQGIDHQGIAEGVGRRASDPIAGGVGCSPRVDRGVGGRYTRSNHSCKALIFIAYNCGWAVRHFLVSGNLIG